MSCRCCPRIGTIVPTYATVIGFDAVTGDRLYAFDRFQSGGVSASSAYSASCEIDTGRVVEQGSAIGSTVPSATELALLHRLDAPLDMRVTDDAGAGSSAYGSAQQSTHLFQHGSLMQWPKVCNIRMDGTPDGNGNYNGALVRFLDVSTTPITELDSFTINLEGWPNYVSGAYEAPYFVVDWDEYRIAVFNGISGKTLYEIDPSASTNYGAIPTGGGPPGANFQWDSSAQLWVGQGATFDSEVNTPGGCGVGGDLLDVTETWGVGAYDSQAVEQGYGQLINGSVSYQKCQFGAAPFQTNYRTWGNLPRLTGDPTTTLHLATKEGGTLGLTKTVTAGTAVNDHDGTLEWSWFSGNAHQWASDRRDMHRGSGGVITYEAVDVSHLFTDVAYDGTNVYVLAPGVSSGTQWLVKLNGSGVEQWSVNIGHSGISAIWWLGGILVATGEWTSSGDTRHIKAFDPSDGSVEWEQFFTRDDGSAGGSGGGIHQLRRSGGLIYAVGVRGLFN